MDDIQGSIFRAIIENDLDAIKMIVSTHPDEINVPSFIAGNSWLAVAAREGHLGIVQELLRGGADPNQPGLSDANALHAAVRGQNPEIVRLMLEHGAIVDTSASVRNPLFAIGYTATDEGDGVLSIVRMLIDAGIDTTVRYNTETMTDMDAVAFAWMWGRRRIARLIAETQVNGDPDKVEALLAHADAVGDANTVPVPPEEVGYAKPS